MGATREWVRATLIWAALAGAVTAGAACQGPPPPLEIDGAPIEIAAPPEPLALTAFVRPGGFSRSRVSPRGVQVRFADVLRESRVFADVLDEPPPPGTPALELELAGADYGEPDAYSLELQVATLRDRQLITSYFTKQTIRQPAGTRRQLTVGPSELGRLTERAIRDLVRQIAADAPRYAQP